MQNNASNLVEFDFSPEVSLPASPAVEEELLGGILLDPPALERVVDSLEIEDFYYHANQLVYEAMLVAREDGLAPTPGVIGDVMIRLDSLKKAGGSAGLWRLVNMVTSSVSVGDNARLLRKRRLERGMMALGEEVRMVGADRKLSLQAKVEQVEQKVLAFTRDAYRPAGFKAPQEAVWEMWEDILNYQRGEVATVYPLGLPALDSVLTGGGTGLGELIVISAPSNTGKSVFAGFWAHAIAFRHNKTAIVYSLEMAEKAYRLRLAAAESGIPAESLKRKNGLKPGEAEKLQNACMRQAALPLRFSDNPYTTSSQICSEVRSLHASLLHTDEPLTTVVIDHALKLRDYRCTDPAHVNHMMGLIVDKFQQLARELNIQIVLLTQFRKTSGKPTVDDLYGAGAVRHDADLILLLHRPELLDPATSEQGICYVEIVKQREGKQGRAKIGFIPEILKFYSIDDLVSQ